MTTDKVICLLMGVIIGLLISIIITECEFMRDDWSCIFQTDCKPFPNEEEFKEQYNNCPLIEIDLVRCGECKKSFEVGGEIFCYNLSVMVGCNFLVKPTDFCSYGERRTDEGTTE